MSTPRIVSWFSCGVASAVATKLALAEAGEGREVVIANCEVQEEHPDNKRFLADCQEWFGQKIVVLGNDSYARSIYEVFEKTRFLVGPSGARCTGELKKTVRYDFQEPGDILVFGYTCDEKPRAERFLKTNFDTPLWPILIEHELTHADCLAIIKRAGIDVPEMYKLVYKNNNCRGCVKGGAGYWNKIRVDFPDFFDRMARMEEELGRTVCKKRWVEDGEQKLKRIPLRELPPDLGCYKSEPEIQCDILCQAAEELIAECDT